MHDFNDYYYYRVVKEMGYKKITETESVAVSALMLDTSRTNTPDKIPSVIEVRQSLILVAQSCIYMSAFLLLFLYN